VSGALVLPATAGRILALPRRALRFPAIITRRGDPEPPAPPPPVLDIHRQPLRFATDWQTAILDECRRHRSLCVPVYAYLRDSGLLSRCLFLSSATPDGPLLFRHIGVPTRLCLGDEWARANLGKPDNAPSDRLETGVAAEYVEAIETGRPILNRVFVTDVMERPLTYTHALVGWRLPDGRRALLSCLELL